MVDGVEVVVHERAQAVAEVGVVVARLVVAQDVFNRKVWTGLVEVLGDLFDVVDEDERARLAHLVLQFVDQPQHELRAVAHGGGHVADEHQFWLEPASLQANFHGHATIALVGANGALGVQRADLALALPQRCARAQLRRHAPHELTQRARLRLGQVRERTLHQVRLLRLVKLLGGLARDVLAHELLDLLFERRGVAQRGFLQLLARLLAHALLRQLLQQFFQRLEQLIHPHLAQHAPCEPLLLEGPVGVLQADLLARLLHLVARRLLPLHQHLHQLAQVVLQLAQRVHEHLLLFGRQVARGVEHGRRVIAEEDGKERVEGRVVARVLDERRAQ